MRLRNSDKIKISPLFLSIFSLYFSIEAQGKSKSLDVPAPCPVSTPIRAASSTSLGGFLSLSECAPQVVHTPAAPVLSLPPPVARIQGLKVAIPAPGEPAPTPAATGKVATYSAAPHRSALLYDGMIRRTAGTYRIDPLFLHALTWTESAYRPTAVSSAGARGLMQIMPGTGRGLGVSTAGLFDPGVNIDAGARHLKKLQRRYGRNLPLILAAYNAGEGAVEKYGRRIPPYRETQAYVRTVMGRYDTLRAASSGVALGGVEIVR